MSRQAIEELLPFYVNGTLNEEEKAQIEQVLAKDPTLQREVEFLKRLRTQIQDMSQEQSPGEFGWQRLKRSLQQEKQKGNLFSRIVAGLAADQDNRPWQALAVAACLLVLVQTVFTVQYWPSDDLVAASGTVQDAAITVTFVPEASEGDIRGLLVQLDLTIIDGPSALGIYQLSAEGDIEQKLKALRAHTNIVESAQKAGQ